MNAPVRLDPYLSGNFAPIASEDDYADLPVSGEIPSALAGAYYRNGPNPQFPPRDPSHHWFAGDGMVHAFFIENGKVAYRNRYVRTEKYRLERAAGRSLFGTFGNPLTSDPEVAGKDGGLANTNVVWHGGRLLALEEAHNPFELDPVTLEPRGYRDYGGAALRFTAHPKIDPETGEMLFFAYSAGPGFFTDKVAFGVADRSGTVTRLDLFQAPYSSMIHDFFATRNYVAFPVLPLAGSLSRVMAGGPAYAWEPEKGAHIGVMRRDAGVDSIRWFETDPCYVFHPMNMWEEGERIFADVMQYPRPPLFPGADGVMAPPQSARLMRWTFDLSEGTNAVRQEPLDDLAGEFPRFDERRAGLTYRHGYFAASRAPNDKIAFDSIAHLDMKTGARAVYSFPQGDRPGEPLFVPASPRAAEGEGFLLSLVYRAAANASELAVFDAQDVAKGPIGAARLPRRVPFGFHGNWRPA
jgi:carotenoid cleavage dioxygenase